MASLSKGKIPTPGYQQNINILEDTIALLFWFYKQPRMGQGTIEHDDPWSVLDHFCFSCNFIWISK